MQQHELRQPKGATHKRKRVGRGNASGHGTYSGKGMKGQKARSGGGVRPGFEGGQLPLVRRMAYKRGFRNPFRVDYEEVNVGELARFAPGAEVTSETLQAVRLVRTNRPVKVLGDGELAVALTVEAVSFSKSARAKIEAAGGSVRWLNGEPVVEESKPTPKMIRAAKKAAASKPAAGSKPAAAVEEANDDAGS
jgi:large subunit ribosomal protein L15